MSLQEPRLGLSASPLLFTLHCIPQNEFANFIKSETLSQCKILNFRFIALNVGDILCQTMGSFPEWQSIFLVHLRTTFLGEKEERGSQHQREGFASSCGATGCDVLQSHRASEPRHLITRLWTEVPVAGHLLASASRKFRQPKARDGGSMQVQEKQSCVYYGENVVGKTLREIGWRQEHSHSLLQSGITFTCRLG
jgi:hypothetical protein